MNKTGFDIVVFDCDSTLSKIEGIDELARLKGQKKKVAKLTKEAMEGRLSFRTALEERLEIVRPSQRDLDWLGRQYIKNLLADARETVFLLRKAGKRVFLISGGYRPAIETMARHLDVPLEDVRAVDLEFDQEGNYLRPNRRNPLARDRGKTMVLKSISREGKTLFVGDGATDLEAKDAVDLFVGFGGVASRPLVKKNAPIFINKPSLRPILKLAKDGVINSRSWKH